MRRMTVSKKSSACMMRSLFFLPLISPVFSTPDMLNFFPAHRRSTIRRVVGPGLTPAADPVSAWGINTPACVISPSAYGGDPTGTSSSSQALSSAVEALISCADVEGSINGAVLDLSGGTWLVDSTVMIPGGYADYTVRGGVLRASATFPSTATLLQLGNLTGTKGSSATNVAVERVTLDGSGRAHTTLAILNGQYCNVGPGVMAYGFNSVGITMTGTGGGYISHSWLGQAPPHGLRNHTTTTATAIILNSTEHDCYVQDVIIWSSRVGVLSLNGGNQMSGVHTW